MNRTTVWISGIFALGLALTACNDDDDEGGAPATSAELQGKWFLRQTVAKGTLAFNFPDVLDTTIRIDSTENFAGTEFYADFKADSTYEFRMPDFDPGLGDILEGLGGEEEAADDSVEIETGKWRLSGTTLTTISSDGDSLDSKATLQGGALVLESAFDTTFTDTSGSGSVDVSFQATLRK